MWYKLRHTQNLGNRRSAEEFCRLYNDRGEWVEEYIPHEYITGTKIGSRHDLKDYSYLDLVLFFKRDKATNQLVRAEKCGRSRGPKIVIGDWLAPHSGSNKLCLRESMLREIGQAGLRFPHDTLRCRLTLKDVQGRIVEDEPYVLVFLPSRHHLLDYEKSKIIFQNADQPSYGIKEILHCVLKEDMPTDVDVLFCIETYSWVVSEEFSLFLRQSEWTGVTLTPLADDALLTPWCRRRFERDQQL